MPLEIELPDDDERISLQEYIDCLEQERFDLSDQGDLIASARYLKKLCNNKDFLVDRIFDELKRSLQFQESNTYAPEVLLLHATGDYFIRANIWKPVTEVERRIPGYRYDVCHDHNFDILTAGYLGPGYQCRTFTYDSATCVGLLGEAVDLNDSGVFALTEGKIALYRAKQDVHIQLPPDRLSVSINLIPNGRSLNEVQFQFDESSRKICRYLDSSGAEVLVRLAGLLGGQECAKVLGRIAQKHPSAKIRAFALVSQLHIDAEHAEAIQADMHVTQSALVCHIVESEMAHYGACMRLSGAET
jgi:hypothetical protein